MPYADCDTLDERCGVCDRCVFEQAAYHHDHPTTLSQREVERL